MLKQGVFAVAGIALACSVQAADWPQFGGLNRDNISPETGLADAWPSGGPKVLWETGVHDGYSGASIVDGKAYLIDRKGDNSLLRCIDMKSGRDLWSVSFSDPGKLKGTRFDGTRGTPTIAEGHVWLVTAYGSFTCIDLKSRKLKWMHHLAKDYDQEVHQFGIAQSPALYGNMVLVAPNSPEAGVAAYDRTSGERLWVSPGLGFHAYISPRVEKICGQDMVLSIGSCEKAERTRGRRNDGERPAEKKELAPGHVVGISPRDGSILWDYDEWMCRGSVPHPVVLPDDRVFVTGGYGAGSAMLKIVKQNNTFDAQVLYKTDDVGSQIHLPILVGSHLFIGSNSNSRKDGLVSFSLDGELVWRTRDIEDAPNFERGSFILADGKLIGLDGKTGVLHLVQADPSEFELLASAQMVEANDMAWAPLALSEGLLLVRDWNTLKCVDLRP
jgi:outer membrane protein assembly factor BamB